MKIDSFAVGSRMGRGGVGRGGVDRKKEFKHVFNQLLHTRITLISSNTVFPTNFSQQRSTLVSNRFFQKNRHVLLALQDSTKNESTNTHVHMRQKAFFL